MAYFQVITYITSVHPAKINVQIYFTNRLPNIHQITIKLTALGLDFTFTLQGDFLSFGKTLVNISERDGGNFPTIEYCSVLNTQWNL